LIGDCHLIDEQDEIKMVIERKTMADLASSIHDGRWNEQKYRALSEYQGKLFYIIEINDITDIFNYQPYRSNINSEALLSATTNLWINHNIPYILLNYITFCIS
jgi:ERCC4-type nuclease